MLANVQLKIKKDAPIRAGHPWVFSNAIERDCRGEPGSLVRVMSHRGDFLGIGMFNPETSIRVRMVCREDRGAIDEMFFARRFAELAEGKKAYLPAQTTGYRIAHGDADYLPGLIVDSYADVLVFQIHTAGMERFRREIIAALQKTFSPRAIVERSDIAARVKEGLTELPARVHYGTIDGEIPFFENGLIFYADVLNGQKTGFFLDQRNTRIRSAAFVSGKTVLNLFGYTGAFSVYAAKAGAKQVVTVDSSQSALDCVARHFQDNALTPAGECLKLDIFASGAGKLLAGYNSDVIICDPPALAKSLKHVPQAMKAYTALNALCFSLLGKGGILITSSCSGRVTLEDFRDVARFAAGAAGRDVRIVDCLGHGYDHTDKLSFPEGRYLKTLILEVIDVIA
ncbi:MAG: class I SAM-dependent rRNA methyltransferase [Candidatus Omnitrophica bacterium]|nr:class I SAM-dependent rRNA methyltransferase [Candidatus Omnitrophota bacterium]